MDVHSEAEQLRQVPMFSYLDAARLKLLILTSDAIEFADGEVLFEQATPSDCAYVIMDGEVDIVGRTLSGEEESLLTRGKNEIVGEMAVLNNTVRSATLKARGRTHVLRISNDDFLKLISENAEVALCIMRELSAKLAKSHEQVERLTKQLTQTAN